MDRLLNLSMREMVQDSIQASSSDVTNPVNRGSTILIKYLTSYLSLVQTLCKLFGELQTTACCAHLVVKSEPPRGKARGNQGPTVWRLLIVISPPRGGRTYVIAPRSDMAFGRTYRWPLPRVKNRCALQGQQRDVFLCQIR